MPIIINSGKFCLIFLEAQLEPKVWPGSQGAFLGEENQSSHPVDCSSFPGGGPTQQPRPAPRRRQQFVRQVLPRGLLEPASPLLVGSWCSLSRNTAPTSLRGWRAAWIRVVPRLPLRQLVDPRNWRSFTYRIMWHFPGLPWLFLLSG